jgi:hypothetical protein
MAVKGKLLLDDNCTTERGKKMVKLNKPWSVRAGAGKWQKNDGYYQSSWTKDLGHTPVMAFVANYKNVIIEVSFRYNKMTLDWHTQCFRIALDNASLYKGHVLSAWANPNNDFIEEGFILQHISKKPDKTIINDIIFDKQALVFKQGQWHTAIIELVDDEALFQMDGNIAYAKSDKINVDKKLFSLTLGKTRHDIKHVRVWNASLKKNWSANKEKILSKRKPFKAQTHTYTKIKK